MLQNTEIIEKLSVEQKIAIACDVGALKRLPEEVGAPAFEARKIDRIFKGGEREYPSYPAMANSWDRALCEKVFARLAQKAQAQGITALLAPRSGVKGTPLSIGASEDPFLAATLMQSFIGGVQSQGSLACVQEEFTDNDLRYMDREFSLRAFHEYYMMPFQGCQPNAFAFPCHRLRGKRGEIQIERVNDFFRAKAAKVGGFTLCSKCDADLTVRALSEGNLLLGASPEYLQNAVQKFLSMQKKVENGEIDCATLDEALADGSAFSVGQLDEAVDRAISFAKLAATTAVQEEEDNLALAATEGSVVLLKNKDVLPFGSMKKLTIVCSTEKRAFAEGLVQSLLDNKAPYFVEVVCGYSLQVERCDDLLREAAMKAPPKSAVLLLLEKPQGGKNPYQLPANQLALVDELKGEERTLVGALLGDQALDLPFEKFLSGLLLLPSVTKSAPRALANILSGKTSPSGKLANTFYENTEEYYKTLTHDRRFGHTKVGPFVGYRHYDSIGLSVKYPFGYGLSYGQFSYHTPTVAGNTLSVLVKNTGKRVASEVVQVYAGKPDSKVAQPKKRLVGFEKITLKAGESKTVRIPLTPDALSVYVNGELTLEGGVYQAYVGGSVTAAKQKCTTTLSGARIKEKKERPVDYLQSRPNLFSGGYTIAKVVRKGEEGKKCRDIGWYFQMLAVIAAMTLGLLWLAGVVTLDELPLFIGLWSGAGGIFVIGALLWIIGKSKGAFRGKEDRVLSTGKAHEEQEKEMPQSYRTLFDMLYEEETEEEEIAKAERKATAIAAEEFIGAFDPSQTFATVCEGLATFITERGILADKNLARKILAGLCSSRLLLLKSNDRELSHRLVDILNEFFGSAPYTQDIGDARSLGEILYAHEGEHAPLHAAMEQCAENRDCMHAVALDFEDIDKATKVLLPLVRFAGRRTKGELYLYLNGNTQKLTLYPNLWWILCAQPTGNVVDGSPAFYDAACVLDLQLALAPECENKTDVPHFNFYQLFKMEQTALRFDGGYALQNLPDEEKFWKKLDRVEKYLFDKTGYSFGSNLNAGLERFATVFLACGGEQENVLDGVVSTRLALLAMSLLGEEAFLDGGLTSHLEAIFGDDTMDETKNTIHSCKAIVTE